MKLQDVLACSLDGTMKQLRSIGLELQQELPDLIGPMLAEDIDVSVFGGKAESPMSGVTLTLKGPLFRACLDVLYRADPLVHKNQRDIDLLLRAPNVQVGWGVSCFLGDGKLPSAQKFELSLRHLVALSGHADLTGTIFGRILPHAPKGYLFGKPVTGHDDQHILITYGDPPDMSIARARVTFGLFEPNIYGFKVNDTLVRTPQDVVAAFEKHR